MFNNREDVTTRNMLDRIRLLQESKTTPNSNLSILMEGKDDAKKALDAIAITDDPKFGTNALQNQIDQFRSFVDSGAQFTEPEDGKVSESPLIYIPSTRNLVFSGIIPCLNNLKFQYVLKTTTGNGCFIWSNGMILNKDNIQILNKLFGNYLTWKDTWNTESADFDKMVKNMLNG